MARNRDDTGCPHRPGMSRRGFLTTVGVGTATVVVRGGMGGPPAEASPAELTSEDMAKITLRINGRPHRLLVEPRWTLLFVLRERLGLTGSKMGCGRGECGACNVLLDNEPRYACLTLAVEAEGREITTIEGLLDGEDLGPTQQAFLAEDAFQCGYCTPGQIMAAEGLLRVNADPAPEEIAAAMSGNLCRCGAYTHIFEAVKHAARARKEQG